MSDNLAEIRKPIEREMKQFDALFNDSLSHSEGVLNHALDYIRKRTGKRMRPMLTMLVAKNFGTPNDATFKGGVGLELLHTASLVHDDVVDHADLRRGHSSVNHLYDNRIAVLVGDYILSTALLNVSATNNIAIVDIISRLGQTLSNGEILQITSNASDAISEEDYYRVILQKTAALFEACCTIGAISVGASEDDIEASREFGKKVGLMFQIKDDIFDYSDSAEIGKPTGNDMREGKLTLPAIHALLSTQDKEMLAIAQRVKSLSASPEDIARLVAFTKQNGGIEYAEKAMHRLHDEALLFISERVGEQTLKNSLHSYLDFIIQRTL